MARMLEFLDEDKRIPDNLMLFWYIIRDIFRQSIDKEKDIHVRKHIQTLNTFKLISNRPQKFLLHLIQTNSLDLNTPYPEEDVDSRMVEIEPIVNYVLANVVRSMRAKEDYVKFPEEDPRIMSK